MDSDKVLRAQLLELLRGGSAHMTFDEAVRDFPMDAVNARPPSVPYTPWHLLEHIRLTQRDILDFVREDSYEEGVWPDDYWPSPDAEADKRAWNETLAAFHEDLAALQGMVNDPATDLTALVPNGDGQTFIREVLLVADHNAYHIGEFAILRQVMGTWPDGRSASE